MTDLRETIETALLADLERQNPDMRAEEGRDTVWLSGGATPQSCGTFINVHDLTDAILSALSGEAVAWREGRPPRVWGRKYLLKIDGEPVVGFYMSGMRGSDGAWCHDLLVGPPRRISLNDPTHWAPLTNDIPPIGEEKREAYALPAQPRAEEGA